MASYKLLILPLRSEPSGDRKSQTCREGRTNRQETDRKERRHWLQFLMTGRKSDPSITFEKWVVDKFGILNND